MEIYIEFNLATWSGQVHGLKYQQISIIEICLYELSLRIYSILWKAELKFTELATGIGEIANLIWSEDFLPLG